MVVKVLGLAGAAVFGLVRLWYRAVLFAPEVGEAAEGR